MKQLPYCSAAKNCGFQRHTQTKIASYDPKKKRFFRSCRPKPSHDGTKFMNNLNSCISSKGVCQMRSNQNMK